jgi:dTDP-4-amino-4,6-dideoxygalactose transaminase
VSIDAWEATLAERDAVAQLYLDLLGRETRFRPVTSRGSNSWYKSILHTTSRRTQADIKQAMAANGISLAGAVYETPLHRQPVLQSDPERFVGAEVFCRRHLCLPIYRGREAADVSRVVTHLAEATREV